MKNTTKIKLMIVKTENKISENHKNEICHFSYVFYVVSGFQD